MNTGGRRQLASRDIEVNTVGMVMMGSGCVRWEESRGGASSSAIVAVVEAVSLF